MKKVAIPIKNEKMCPLFEQCTQFRIFTIKDQKKKDENLLDASRHHSGLSPFWLYSNGVTDVIVNRIGEQSVSKFNGLKINVFVGVETKNPDSLVEDYIEGNIETNPELCEIP